MIYVASPSYWPVLLAASLVIMAGGALMHLAQVVVGRLLSIYCIYRFAMEHHHRPAGYTISPQFLEGANIRATRHAA